MSKDDDINSPLYQAVMSGDTERFNTEITNIVRENELPHDMAMIFSVFIRKDDGVKMTKLLAAADLIERVRANSNSIEAITESGKLDFNPHTRVDLRTLINYVGIGDSQSMPIKANTMFAVVKSPQFAAAIKEGDLSVSMALSNLMTRNGPQTRRIEPILEAIEASAPDKMADIVKNAFLASLDGAVREHDPHCFRSGARESFDLVASKLTQEGADEIALKLTLHIGEQGPEFESRQKAIYDLASDDVLKKLHKKMAAAGATGTLNALNDRIGSSIDPKDTLMAACGVEVGESTTKQAHARSLDTLKDVLKNDFNEDDIFTAMQAAIGAKKDSHLAELINYSLDKRFANILNRETADHSTLLIKALKVKNVNKYDPAENPVVERMAQLLLHEQVSCQPDSQGNHPLSILAERGMKDGPTYLDVAESMKQEVGLRYAGPRMLAELQAKLAIAQQAKALGLGDNVIAALLGAPAAAAPQQQTPRALGSHTARIVEAQDEKKKDDERTPG